MRTILGSVPGFHTAILGRAFRTDNPEMAVKEEPHEHVHAYAHNRVTKIGDKQIRAIMKNNRFAEDVKRRRAELDAEAAAAEGPQGRITPG